MRFKLNNGIEIPALGIGTFKISAADARVSVRQALKMGYRLVDTANIYDNEVAVGKAIKESGVDRSEIFVSSKLWPSEYENDNAVDETLDRLGLDYIDLLFIHQPTPNYMNGYRQLEKAYKQGKIKAIGLSNCEEELDDILNNCEIKPQIMQVEAHPHYTQDKLREKLDKDGIKLMAWYPLAHGDAGLMQDETFVTLSKKHNKSVAQIILRWHVQFGNIVIPGSKSVEHIKENFDIFDFELSDEDMKMIAAANKNTRYHPRKPGDIERYMIMKPNYEVKDYD